MVQTAALAAHHASQRRREPNVFTPAVRSTSSFSSFLRDNYRALRSIYRRNSSAASTGNLAVPPVDRSGSYVVDPIPTTEEETHMPQSNATSSNPVHSPQTANPLVNTTVQNSRAARQHESFLAWFVDRLPRGIRNYAHRRPVSFLVALHSIGAGVLLAIVVLLTSSFRRLESDEWGVAYDVYARRLSQGVKDEGLHFGPLNFKFKKYKSTYSTLRVPEKGLLSCVSNDGLNIQINVALHYVPDKRHLGEITRVYRDEVRYKGVIQLAATSAIQHGCGDFSSSEIKAERASVQQRMLEYVQLKLQGPSATGSNSQICKEECIKEKGGMFALAVGLSLDSVILPERLRDAISAKRSAAEEINLAILHRKQSRIEANTKLRTAHTEASVIKLRAQEQAIVIQKNAGFRANATRTAFQKEIESYQLVMRTLNLSGQDFLSYLETRVIEKLEGVEVSVMEPAPSSYRDEL